MAWPVPPLRPRKAEEREKSKLEKFIAFADKLSLKSGIWTSYLALPMIGVIVYTALLRYLFDIAVDWGFEIALFIYGVHCLLGGGYTLLVRGHIAVDMLPRRLPIRAQKYVLILSLLIVIGVCSIMVWQGSVWAWKSTKIWERSIHQTVFNPPIWWFKWVVPISAALIVIQALADLLKTIQSLAVPEKGE
jgi:TRAP-type mannitol/chloroaromatic compound transport system permease small subunit